MKGREITCVKLSVLSRGGAFSWAEEVNMKVYWGEFRMARRDGGGGGREKRGGVPTVTHMYSRREIERSRRGFQDEKGYISPGKFYGQGAELCALLRQYDSLRGSGRDSGRLVL